jgi:hypothetical protein
MVVACQAWDFMSSMLELSRAVRHFHDCSSLGDYRMSLQMPPQLSPAPGLRHPQLTAAELEPLRAARVASPAMALPSFAGG